MRKLAGIVFILALMTTAAAAQSVGVSRIETKDLRLLYYDPLQTYLTPYVGQAFENSMRFQRRMYDWTPYDKPTVLLTDLADNGGASVRSAPNNGLLVNVAPISTTFETFTPGERFFTLMNHELTHVATMDVANAQDLWWRGFFHGKPLPQTEHPETILYSFLATPRTNVPRWYLEGSAVFMETWMGGGFGRAQGGYDEMVFRAMVRDHAHFFDPVGLEAEGNAIDFQVGANDYLYGTRFFSYLALTYSPEKVIAWLKRGPDSYGYYEAQFKHVFGKSLNASWSDWIAFEHRFQKENLKSVAQFPLTKVQHITLAGLGSVSRSYYDAKTNSLIAGFRNVGVIANIGMIPLEGGPIRKLTNLKGPALYRATSLAYDAALRKVYYTTDNNALRDLMEIDLGTGKVAMLVEDGRVGDIVVNPIDHSIWGVRHLNGIDTLVRLERGTTLWHQVMTFTYGRALSDLDISPDGTMLSASVAEIDGKQRIAVVALPALLAGQWTELHTMTLKGALPEGGAFSRDGRYLYATAYYTGVSNVYRLDLASDAVDAVSNAETGFFRPLPMDDGSLIVFEYTGQGLSPVRFTPKPLNDLGAVKFLGTQVVNKHPIVKSWAVGSPSRIPFDQLVTDRGDYQPLHQLQFDTTYPFVSGYKNHAAIGWHFQWEDPLQYDQVWANIAYSPATGLKHGQNLHGEVGIHTLYWHAIYKHNGADFFDLFGPVERSRKGDQLLMGYKDILIYDVPRQLSFNADVNLYSGLDTLPGAQGIRSAGHQLAVGKLGLDYTNIDHSLGAVDAETGYHVYGNLTGQYGKNQFFPRAMAGFDIGTPLNWNHASVWLYTAAGISGGNRNSPLRSFYFGAFGNNFVDDRDEKRYRDWDSFPGYRIDSIASRNFVKAVGELNLPPVRFADVGVPSFFLSSARTAVFAGVLESDPGASDSHTAETAGAQVDFNFTVAVRLPLTLSFGYAKGLGGAGHRDELMASLKILYTVAEGR